MTLFEIDNQIKRCFLDGDDVIDTETGEMFDADYLDQLKMDRSEKIKNIALYIKNLDAEAEALKKEKMRFAARQSAAEKKKESLKNYLSKFLNEGEKIKDTQYSISWRKSTSVEVSDINLLPMDYLVFKNPEPDKKLLAEALKSGMEIEGAKLVTKQNMTLG